MTAHSARVWLVYASLGLLFGMIIFLLVAPTFGYPLRGPQALRIGEIVFPVFLGYLTASVSFVISSSPTPTIKKDRQRLLSILVRGPIIVYAVSMLLLFFNFGFTNREMAQIGEGMDMDTLALWVSILLGILTATTTLLIGALFGNEANFEREE